MFCFMFYILMILHGKCKIIRNLTSKKDSLSIWATSIFYQNIKKLQLFQFEHFTDYIWKWVTFNCLVFEFKSTATHCTQHTACPVTRAQLTELLFQFRFTTTLSHCNNQPPPDPRICTVLCIEQDKVKVYLIYTGCSVLKVYYFWPCSHWNRHFKPKFNISSGSLLWDIW